MTSSTPVQLVCPRCGAVNRIPGTRLGDAPLCGKCRNKLFGGGPVAVGDGDFARFIEKNDLPLVVDFWASWCGPCRQFAPVFEQTAAGMATRATFLKLDTEASPRTAAHYRIRSIPTLMMFHRGREVARVSGALPTGQFEQWLNQQLSSLAR